MPFEVFPYTNFHELNLDTIISYVTQIKDKTENIDASVEEAEAAAEIATNMAKAYVTPLMFGAKADGVTNDSDAVQQAINECPDYAFVLITPNTKWIKANIVFRNEIPVIDNSGYDQTTDKFSGQINYYLKTDDPGTKNANGLIIHAEHHPWLGVDGTSPNGYASLQLGVDGVNKSNLMIEPYTFNNVDYVLASLRNIINGQTLGYVQSLGGDNGHNEIGLNRAPIPGIALTIGNRETTRDLVSNYYAQPSKNVVFNLISNNTVIWTITAFPDGRLLFNSLSNKRIIFMADGTIRHEYATRSNSPITNNIVPNYVGEEVLETTTNTWYKSYGTSAGQWKAITS